MIFDQSIVYHNGTIVYTKKCLLHLHTRLLKYCSTLQTDLMRLEEWSKLWKLNFNAAKCKVLSFGRILKYNYTYKLCNINLETVVEFNDLGIIKSRIKFTMEAAYQENCLLSQSSAWSK